MILRYSKQERITVVQITCDESMHHSSRSIHRKMFPDLSDVIQAKKCYMLQTLLIWSLIDMWQSNNTPRLRMDSTG